MNKAITDGVVFMPPAFAGGLDMWSSGDGTPGSDTYANALNAAFVSADADFAGCLELQKTENVQKLRYMGETPLLPGCYLRISAKIKAISGNLPSVRIAGWAGGAGGVHVTGLTEIGPSVTLDSYGEVVEVSAIVGSGMRTGVDMVWGPQALYGHFGLDLTGQTGGVVRIDDIVIEDVTSAFLRDMMDWVDVRDFGAVGDGVTDDMAAFEAADAAAAGRDILVPSGTYFLGDSVTLQNRVRFQGTVTMPDDKILSLTKNFDFPAYSDAFGDDKLAFRKAFQALLNNSGHESLDLGGRLIALDEPIDMQAAVGNKTSYAQRRVIRNGQFSTISGPAWDTDVVTSQASYSPGNSLKLTNVVDVANIPVGALVEGNGVGREVYVRDKNVATQEITLSAQLYDASGTQVFTFRRFKYMLDFSGFQWLTKFALSDIEFQCGGDCSAILLPPSGVSFQLRDCFITKPKDRGITSHGEGCQGMLVDRCQFLSDEGSKASTERVSIAFNVNANDAKVRNNRAVHFRHFAVLAGSGSIITGNHWFQGDGQNNAVRTAGVVLSRTNCRATINGNYVDNSFIEWTNEHDSAPEFSSELSFSGMSITDNIFLCSDVAPWFTFIVVKPHGAGHFLNGMSVMGNVFRSIGQNIDRVEKIDTSFADLDYNRFSRVTFADNMYNMVNVPVSSPLVLEHSENSPSNSWVVDCAPKLPFEAWAQTVESVIAAGPLRDSSGAVAFVTPYYQGKQGPSLDQIKLTWPQPVEGTVILRVRIDDPF